MSNLRPRLAALVLAHVLLCATRPASAQTFTNTSVNPIDGLSDIATVTFTEVTGALVGSSLVAGSSLYLQAVVTNTSARAGYETANTLGGVFFSIAGHTANDLVPERAVTTGPIFDASQCDGTSGALCSSSAVDVGKYWGYTYASSGTFTGSANGTTCPSASTMTGHYGVTVAGYACVTNPAGGQSTQFGAAPPSLVKTVAAPQFSLVGPAMADAASASAVAADPLINTSMILYFGLPSGIGPLTVNSVTFAYGAAPAIATGGLFRSASEPAGLTILGVGLAVVTGARYRRRAK